MHRLEQERKQNPTNKDFLQKSGTVHGRNYVHIDAKQKMRSLVSYTILAMNALGVCMVLCIYWVAYISAMCHTVADITKEQEMDRPSFIPNSRRLQNIQSIREHHIQIKNTTFGSNFCVQEYSPSLFTSTEKMVTAYTWEKSATSPTSQRRKYIRWVSAQPPTGIPKNSVIITWFPAGLWLLK